MSHPLAIDIDFDGSRLKARRLAAGWGRLKFAKKLGTDVSRVWKWETGEFRPSAPYLEKITDLLGCSPDDLCTPAAGHADAP